MAGGAALLRVALALGVSFVSSAHLRTISERTARKLVEEALVALGESRASIRIGPWDYYWAPEFYRFQAWRPGIPGSDGVAILQTYYFAVNPWTGDVWDAMGCRRITSPAIQKKQELIWKRFQLSADNRVALRDKSPACCSFIQGKTGDPLK